MLLLYSITRFLGISTIHTHFAKNHNGHLLIKFSSNNVYSSKLSIGFLFVSINWDRHSIQIYFLLGCRIYSFYFFLIGIFFSTIPKVIISPNCVVIIIPLDCYLLELHMAHFKLHKLRNLISKKLIGNFSLSMLPSAFVFSFAFL